MPVTPFLPIRHPVTESGPLALMTEPWRAWASELNSIVLQINQLPGVNRLTLAELNALGLAPVDEGYLAFEHVYGHFLRWTGTVWQFAPGDCGSGFWSLRPVAPQEVGWQLCDGTVTDYLTVGGATLTVTAFTTPNVTAGTFLKVLAAYTGTIEAAIAAGLSGAPTISGSTDIAGDHNHDVNAHRHALQTNGQAASGVDITVSNSSTQDDIFNDSGTSSDGDHAHGSSSLVGEIGTLAVNAAGRPPSLGGLLYFRR